jgi:predicted  nucleic acid-binding Zn-ribbon protein
VNNHLRRSIDTSARKIYSAPLLSMSENEFKYWAFVCFSPQDNGVPISGAPEVGRITWGDSLAAALKNFQTPADFVGHLNAHGEIVPERMEAVFCDAQELPEGANLGDSAREALAQSRFLIVICSPRSAVSLHVNEAVRVFKQLGRGSRILPFVIAGEPNAETARQRGLFADDEAFPPAMRHPLLPDGTVDTSRPERGYIFADARHGDDRREILAKDLSQAESILERAKIQLIAGVIGVGFNNLWQREQKRRFAGFAEAQSQLQEAWAQARTAHAETEACQKQAQALQQEARAAESKVLDAQRQLEEARQQVRAAQEKILESQNLTPDVKGQIQSAQQQADEARDLVRQLQNQVRAAESQLESARQSAQETQGQLAEARSQVQAAQEKLSEAQNQARIAQQQLKAAQAQALDAQSKISEAQKPPVELQNQLQLALTKVAEAEHQVAEIQNRTRDVQSQIDAAQQQVRAAEESAHNAKRLTKIFAVLAVLAALAAGVVLSHRKTVVPDLAKTAEVRPAEIRPVPENVVTNILTDDQIRAALPAADNLDSFIAQQVAPERLSGFITNLPTGDHRAKMIAELCARWTNTPAALAWAQTLPDENEKANAFGRIIGTWARNDFSAARNFVSGLTNDAQEISAQLSLAEPWAQKNARELCTNALALTAGEVQTRWLAAACEQLATNDFAGTVALLSPLADAELRQNLLAQSAHAAAGMQPEAVAKFIATMSAGDDQQAALQGLLSIWATNQPAAALGWLQSFPATNAPPQAAQFVLNTWAQSEPAAAANWLTNSADAATNETLISAFLDGAVAKYPAFAAQWTQSVTNETLRQKFQTQVAQQWLKADTNAAAKWIETLNLPDAAKQSLKAP